MYVYTPKKCEKHCSIYHLKSWKHPFYKGLKEKRKYKNDEKRRRGYWVFEKQKNYKEWL